MADIKRTRRSRTAPFGMMDARNVSDPEAQRAITQIQENLYALQEQIDQIKPVVTVMDDVVAEEPRQPELPVPTPVSADTWVRAASESALVALIASLGLVPPKLGLVTDGIDKGLCYALSYAANGIIREWRCITIRVVTGFPQIPAAMLPRQIYRAGLLWHARGGDTVWTLGSFVFNALTGGPGT